MGFADQPKDDPEFDLTTCSGIPRRSYYVQGTGLGSVGDQNPLPRFILLVQDRSKRLCDSDRVTVTARSKTNIKFLLVEHTTRIDSQQSCILFC